MSDGSLKIHYETIGTISKIDINGMGIFRSGKGKVQQTLKIAQRCEIGDKVVRLKGNANNPMEIISQSMWEAMPKDEKEVDNLSLKENADVESLQKSLQEVLEEIKNLAGRVATLETYIIVSTTAKEKTKRKSDNLPLNDGAKPMEEK